MSVLVAITGFFSFCLSLFAEHILGVAPCPLCLVERYAWGSVAIVAIASILLSGFRVFLPVILVVISLLSGYHVAVSSGFVRDRCALQSPPQSEEGFKQALFSKKPSGCSSSMFKVFGYSAELCSLAVSLSLLGLMIIPRKRAVFSLALFLFSLWSLKSFALFVDPITTPCWSCMLPIQFGEKVCFCPGTPPKSGVSLSLWEPALLVEVSREPFVLHSFDNLKFGKQSESNLGAISTEKYGESAFYYVRVIKFPVLDMIDILPDSSREEEISIGYLSELDPAWSQDDLAAIFHPEASLFSGLPAQAACAADCVSASAGSSSDKLFWCAGCSGSLYPLSGYIAHHTHSAQSAFLILQRVLAKLHRQRLLLAYEDDNFCEAEYMPIIKKSAYKVQLVKPRLQKRGPCRPLGSSSLVWASMLAGCKGGEPFVFLVWRKRHLCLDVVKPSASVVGGGT